MDRVACNSTCESVRSAVGGTRRQRGGALMVAMVMIFMLSIMGVSAMRGSSLEQRMAANSIMTSNTFQAAESATEIVLNDPNQMVAAYMGGSVTLDTSGHAPESMDSEVTLTYTGDGPAPGYSAGAGQALFRALRFVAEGSANIDAASANSTVRQGAYRVVPN